MEFKGELSTWLWIWAIMVIWVATFQSLDKTPKVNLAIAFLANMSLNHFFGALINVFPWYSTPDYEYVRLGFIHSAYGIAAFALSTTTVVPLAAHIISSRMVKERQCSPNPKLPMVYLVIGAVFYFFLLPIVITIPTIGQLGQIGWIYMMAAVCLACWKAHYFQEGKWALMKWPLRVSPLPLFTMLTQGFLGLGIAPLMTIAIFISSFYRPRWHIVLGSLLAIYLGLSIFVAYMTYRDDLRMAVWEDYGGQTGFQNKTGPIKDMVTNFKLFDIFDENDLSTVNGRLNQNVLVGMVVDNFLSGNVTYSKGQSISDSLLALVPRILWPDKPFKAGSGNLASDYSGQQFAEGTAVGVGPVVEYYINFGIPGIVIGFFILGCLVSFFDISAGVSLQQGNWIGFMFWYISGLSLLSTGSLVELTSGTVFAMIACAMTNRFVKDRFR